MFESLGGKLDSVFEKLKKRGALSESDVTDALRDIRIALLEADVALPVVKDFIASVKEKAIGESVLNSVTPGQQVVKVVHDQLIETLGNDANENALNLKTTPPAVILMVGLQGAGKTTTTGKLGVHLQKQKKKVLMASLDVYRPAAQQQLAVLGQQNQIETLSTVMGEMPSAITKRALNEGKLGGYDVVILDTAGRLHIDDALMDEVKDVKAIANPVETLLVADAMTGQDAVTVASEFRQKIGVTGLVLTRVDGDGRGGAALSMRAIAECPIKFLGTGEKTSALEAFNAERVAGRILGMGDVVALVEKAQENFDEDQAQKMAKKMEKGLFDLQDFSDQLKQMQKMGGMQGIMSMMPGMGKMQKQLGDNIPDDKVINRQIAIISSMTPAERKTPKIIHANRKRRIALGSGTTVQDVNKILKQHKQMSTAMKKMKSMGKKGLLRGGLNSLMPSGMKPPIGGFPGGGMPPFGN